VCCKTSQVGGGVDDSHEVPMSEQAIDVADALHTLMVAFVKCDGLIAGQAAADCDALYS